MPRNRRPASSVIASRRTLRFAGVLRSAIRRDSVGCEARCVSVDSGVAPREPLAARRRPAS